MPAPGSVLRQLSSSKVAQLHPCAASFQGLRHASTADKLRLAALQDQSIKILLVVQVCYTLSCLLT